jgi:hypothetical protein
LLFVPLLASLFHGGFPPYSNPIFRSGEVCRHSKINNPQDISDVHLGVHYHAARAGHSQDLLCT